MKVLHSADWHLGAALGRDSGALRRELNVIPGKIAELVRQLNCDLVLLSGDLMDSTPSREVLELLKDALETMAVPVLIAPGNHDFVSATSPWLTEIFPKNVHIFKNPRMEAVILPELDCRVYGAGYDSMDCPPLLRDFRAEGTERHVLGLLHADPQTLHSPYCPITAEQVRESGLDYLALGHIHKSGSFRAGSTLCAWPGCPMGRGFDECGEKGVLLVTLDETADVQFIPLDAPRFHDLHICADGNPRRALAKALPPAATKDYFRVTLTGECAPWDSDALRLAFSNYAHLELTDKTVPPADLWATAGADTLEGIYFQMLRNLLEEEPHLSDRIRLAAKISRQLLDGQEVTLP